jgi:aspartate carbamoyltransferase catalytic subunit
MPRHLIDISDISRDDVDQLFGMADEGLRPRGLAGLTYLSAFFQESTRTRLGFMVAAARQGATVLDMGSTDRLRLEPTEDQQMVLAGVGDVAAVRHWDATFARELAARGRCCVVNAGAAGVSHPTQALIDVYTLTKAFRRDISGLHVLFVGSLLRSAECFRKLAAVLGVRVTQCGVDADPSQDELLRCQAEFYAADVIYIQSLSDTDYSGPDLNIGPSGPALPQWTADAVDRSSGLIMHALPRGPELPDSLMWNKRSLVAEQVEHGLSMRSAVLRWLVHPS